ncbi:MAG TPA: hypothetical protein VGD67_06575 [Pseudonocardiaceae bacterium]
MNDMDDDVVTYLREVVMLARHGDDEAALLLARSELPRLAAAWCALLDNPEVTPAPGIRQLAYAHLIAQEDHDEVAVRSRELPAEAVADRH